MWKMASFCTAALICCFAGVEGMGQNSTPAREEEAELTRQLLLVRRIYVDKLNGHNAEQIRDMLIASLQASRVFLLTENPERADAVLKGTAEDVVFQETHQSSEGVNARLSTGTSTVNGTRLPSSGVSVGDRETLRISERRHEALATLRLLNKDGDVIWSTTQESRGAKFKGAGSDVADKVARKLAEDFRRLRGSGGRE
jgi:hypothetical protein